MSIETRKLTHLKVKTFFEQASAEIIDAVKMHVLSYDIKYLSVCVC